MPLFGWKRADGTRRYRVAYIEIPKKNGKSAICSGVGLYLMAGDGEPGAQVYCAAASRDQAGIVYREASAMAKASPLLKDYIVPSDSTKNLALPSANAFLRAISHEAFTAEGLNIHGLVFDELHAQPDRRLWDTLRYGGAARKQPLLIAITTAGYDRNSICWEQHERAQKVIDGVIQDDSFFAYIRAAGSADDWKDPATWRKSNPSLGTIINEEDFRQEFQEALESPTKENAFKRYRLNVWTEQDVRWLPLESWDACSNELDLAALAGRECYAGLDLASRMDLSAFVLMFPRQTDAGLNYDVLPFFWSPQDGAQKREVQDGAPYLTWQRQGLLELTPGNMTDYDRIRARVGELGKKYRIREIAFDRWNACQLTQQLAGDGFTMVEFGQGFRDQSAPSKDLEALVTGRRLSHGGNPVLRWMASNVTVETDAAGNIKPTRARSSEKIDGVVAMVMALGRAALSPQARQSVYASRGLLAV